MNVKLKILSPLVKVFADEEPLEHAECFLPSGFRNETLSFQVAYSLSEMNWQHTAIIELLSPLKDIMRVRQVELVPVGLAAFPDADDNYLRRMPGLYPDRLADLENGQIRLHAGQWRAVWVDVEPVGMTAAGVYPVEVIIRDQAGDICARRELSVEFLDAALPEQELRHTKWFYTDCLAEYYGVAAFSEKHWEIIENFMASAAKRGINMILTPTFTPPLDTAVGHERLTTQLVDVTLEFGQYTFGFTKLKRWFDLGRRVGIKYFEISHLFTQWGAKAAPKVMAQVAGEYQQIFGWETSATGPEYRAFLAEYLTALTARLREWGLAGQCYFHISDEPSLEDLPAYIAARDLIAPYVEGFPIIDALSDFEFYKSGALAKPVPANNHIQPFIDAGVKGLWTYYCIGQYKDVSNMFMAMPSARNRILGIQIYKYDIEGFLHWGFNFYNSQYSLKRVNPYAVTDADGFTPSGDAFQVYPGPDGKPEESLRMMVTTQALYDLRALKMLESLTDKAFVVALIEDGVVEPITFASYPKSDFYLLNLRQRVNSEIMKRLP